MGNHTHMTDQINGLKIRTFKHKSSSKTSPHGKLPVVKQETCVPIKKAHRDRGKNPSELRIILVERDFKKDKERKGSRVGYMCEKYCSDDEDDLELNQSDLQPKAHNAFFQFRMDPVSKNRHVSQRGSKQQSTIVQSMAAEWNSMSSEEKLPYQTRANEARYEYNRQKAKRLKQDAINKTRNLTSHVWPNCGSIGFDLQNTNDGSAIEAVESNMFPVAQYTCEKDMYSCLDLNDTFCAARNNSFASSRALENNVDSRCDPSSYHRYHGWSYPYSVTYPGTELSAYTDSAVMHIPTGSYRAPNLQSQFAYNTYSGLEYSFELQRRQAELLGQTLTTNSGMDF